MELRDYLAIARKWLWLFVLATVVAAIGAWITTRALPKTYRSDTTVMVGRPTSNPDPNVQQLFLGQTLATTYAQMAVREPVLQAVIDSLDLRATYQQLQGMVRAQPVAGSQLLEIRVVDRDPIRAQVLANEVGRQLTVMGPSPEARRHKENVDFAQAQVAQLRDNLTHAQAELDEIDTRLASESSARAIGDLQSKKNALLAKSETWRSQLADYLNFAEGSEVNSLSIIEAAAPGIQVGPNVRMNVLMAALIGFGLALGAVLLIEYLDDTVKTSEQLERRLGLSGLATIERISGVEHRRDALVTVLSPRSPAAEAYRVLRTNLQFALLDTRGTVVITSANPGEGKTATAANVAVAMAQGGRKVILMDADLRKPAIHRMFQLPNSTGMTSLLVDEGLAIEEVLAPAEGIDGLEVLTSGPLPPNPAEMLDSPRMDHLMDQLRERADFVIVDSPPLLIVVDAAVLAKNADGTLLIFDSCATRVDSAKRAMQALARVGVKPIGGVINRLDRAKVGGYYYYAYRDRYGDYYGRTGSEGGDDGPPPPAGPRPRSWRRLREELAHRMAS
jgi:non-specific protein-tyrosine kinase